MMFAISALTGSMHLEVLRRAFARPANFILESEPPSSRESHDSRHLFDPEVARWVQEERLYYLESILRNSPTDLLVTLKVRREEEVFQWLLGWGSHVRVLEPESLRERLIAEKRNATLKRYETV